MRKVIAVNSLTNLLLYFSNVVSTFFLTPVLVRALGNEAYGLWELVLSVAGYMGVLDLGVSPALVRFVAKINAEGDSKRLREILSSASIILFGAGTIAFVIMLVFSTQPTFLLSKGSGLLSEWRYVAVAVGLLFAIKFIGTLFTAYFMGMQRHFIPNTWRIIIVITKTLVLYAGLKGNWLEPLYLLSMVVVVEGLVEYGVLAGIAWRSQGFPLSFQYVKRDAVRDLLSFGLKSTLLIAARRIQYQTIPILISKILGTGYIVFFAIPNRLTQYVQGVSAALAAPLMPLFSAKAIEGKVAEQKTWFIAAKAMQLILFSAPILLFTLGSAFIKRWIGVEYGANADILLPFMCAGMMVEGIAPNSTRVLAANGVHGSIAKMNVILAVIGVFLTAIMLKFYGIMGVGISLFLYTTVSAIYAWKKASILLEIPIGKHLKVTLVPMIVPLCILTVSVTVLRIIFKDNNYLSIMTVGILSMILYMIAIYYLTFDHDTKNSIRTALQKMWRNRIG